VVAPAAPILLLLLLLAWARGHTPATLKTLGRRPLCKLNVLSEFLSVLRNLACSILQAIAMECVRKRGWPARKQGYCIVMKHILAIQ
jgi:hypothetical protein